MMLQILAKWLNRGCWSTISYVVLNINVFAQLHWTRSFQHSELASAQDNVGIYVNLLFIHQELYNLLSPSPSQAWLLAFVLETRNLMHYLPCWSFIRYTT